MKEPTDATPPLASPTAIRPKATAFLVSWYNRLADLVHYHPQLAQRHRALDKVWPLLLHRLGLTVSTMTDFLLPTHNLPLQCHNHNYHERRRNSLEAILHLYRTTCRRR